MVIIAPVGWCLSLAGETFHLQKLFPCTSPQALPSTCSADQLSWLKWRNVKKPPAGSRARRLCSSLEVKPGRIGSVRGRRPGRRTQWKHSHFRKTAIAAVSHIASPMWMNFELIKPGLWALCTLTVPLCSCLRTRPAVPTQLHHMVKLQPKPKHKSTCHCIFSTSAIETLLHMSLRPCSS